MAALQTVSTARGSWRGGERSRSSARIQVSKGITLDLKHLRTGLYCHMSPRSPCSRVCGSVVRYLLLSPPVQIGLQRNLWDICWLYLPSGIIYLFINLFYEDYTCYTVQFFTDHSFFRVYNPWLSGKCDTIVCLLLLEWAIYCELMHLHRDCSSTFIFVFNLKFFEMYKWDFDIPFAMD